MADDNKIGLEAIFENEDFLKGIAEYNSAISDSNAATEEGADSMGSAWEGLSVIGGAAWGAIAAAVAGATAELYLAIDAASQTEDVMAALDFQIGKTGEDTGITKEQALGLADSLSKILPIDDEVITSAITLGMRFDGVNKDNIQPLLLAAADLSASTGKDLPASMKELALAITDPQKAMRLLRDANITLSDAQQKQLLDWKKQGDSASITSFILGEVNSKVGGLAETMGQTASGKMKIMQTALGNLQEDLGGGFLNALKGAFDKITEFANDPKTIAFFTDLGASVGTFASNVIDNMPSIMNAIQTVFTWLENNQPVIVGVLSVITVAMGVFAASTVAAFLATAEISVPLIAAIAAIGIVSALLFRAWTEDWGGIQEKLQAAYLQIKPVLDKLQAWLAVNLPVAIRFLSDLWSQVLLPAIQGFIAWYLDNVLPVLVQLVLWLGTNVPIAIQAVSSFFTGTLIPAISAVSAFINANIMPTLIALSNLLSAAVGLALRAFAALWQNVIVPALSKASGFISANLVPVLTSLGVIVSTKVTPILAPFAKFISDTLAKAFQTLQSVIKSVDGAIQDLADALNSITIPDALTPGSPTPFEIGLKGINAELDKLASARLPAVALQFSALGDVRAVQNAPGTQGSTSVSNSSQTIRNYLYGSKFEVNNRANMLDILNGLQ